jgi:hypothetical protein
MNIDHADNSPDEDVEIEPEPLDDADVAAVLALLEG